ncbi:hypothetical protein BJ875DRAFT_93281 [Amylocarpus encephaloides]|uniref:Uncharacterized protein n=1 Tax=Amylocarpus encephaloides TaxID=45428 RepID=A0A9P8C3I7_9HELO|nr:hypothetical protein BJ875DRAFT_93281 [Amylocarpus encephaloides]
MIRYYLSARISSISLDLGCVLVLWLLLGRRAFLMFVAPPCHNPNCVLYAYVVLDLNHENRSQRKFLCKGLQAQKPFYSRSSILLNRLQIRNMFTPSKLIVFNVTCWGVLG